VTSQQVGQYSSLSCVVTTVRGINSSVDIVWNINDEEMSGVNESVETRGNSLVYYSHYRLLLSGGDNGTTYQCSVKIHTTPLVNVASTFKGESVYIQFTLNHSLYISVNIHSMQQPSAGSSYNILCPAFVSGQSNSTFTWTGPNGVITDEGRLTVVTDISNDNASTSSVQFSYLKEDDEGSYKCDVTVFGYNYSTSSSVELNNLAGV